MASSIGGTRISPLTSLQSPTALHLPSRVAGNHAPATGKNPTRLAARKPAPPAAGGHASPAAEAHDDWRPPLPCCTGTTALAP